MMAGYQRLPVSPSTDEKTIFLGEEVVLAAQQPQRPSLGQRIVARLLRLSVGLLALLGLLQLISFTPLRQFTPDVLNNFAKHGKHRHGRHAAHHPHHGPGHHGPPPFFHPKPIECFDLSDSKAAVNFSITLPHPGAPLHLSPSLGNADIQLYTDEEDKEAGVDGLPHLPHMPHPPRPPHLPQPPHGPPGRGPPGPPGRGPPGPPGPPHMPHGKPQTIVVEVERTKESKLTSEDFDIQKAKDDEEDKKESQVFVCSLELPMHQVGLGLFHEKPGKDRGPAPPKQSSSDDKKEEDDEKPQPPARKHEKFPSVALSIRHPSGEPFTVTSAMPFFHPPPPPPHGGPHPPHRGPHPPPHRDGPHPPPPPPQSMSEHSTRNGVIIVVSTFANKMCGAGRKLMTTISRPSS